MVLLGVVLLVVMVLIIFGQPTMVMVICLLASRLFDRIALLDTRIVALPLELCVGGERQDPLHRLTNFEDPLPVSAGPDAEDIFAIANTKNGATDLITGVAELVADYGKQQVLPITVSNTLTQAHYPLATVLILFVLPYWTNALLEQVVV